MREKDGRSSKDEYQKPTTLYKEKPRRLRQASLSLEALAEISVKTAVKVAALRVPERRTPGVVGL